MTQLRLWFWQLRVAYLNACLDRMPAYDPYTIDTILARDAAIRNADTGTIDPNLKTLSHQVISDFVL